MEILGVGPQELIFIVIIALIVLGPKDMQKAGRTIGQWLNKIVKSDGWKAFQQTSSQLRDLPTTLMREANVDLAETEKEIRKATKMPPLPGMPLKNDPGPAIKPSGDLPQPQQAEYSIQPPASIPISGVDVSHQATTTEKESNVEDGAISDVSTPDQNA